MVTKEQAEALVSKANDLETKVKELETREKGIASVLSTGVGPAVHGSRMDSDESRAMRAFGCSHVKQLMDVNTGDPKFRHVPHELKGLVMQLKQAVDVSRMMAQTFRGGEADVFGTTGDTDKIGRVKSILDTRYAKNELVPRLKAFGSTVSNAGDEWVPTLISSTYIPEFELDFLLEGKFQQINMPSNPYDLAKQYGVTKARKIAESTAITDTNFSTDKIRFTATKSGEYYIMPEELTEDSAPDIMSAARDEVVRAQLRAWETAIINGDDDGTHIDSDTQAAAADVAEKFCKGLRRQALANSANGSTTDFSNAAVAVTGLRTMRARMKRFGVNPLELLWVCGPAVYAQLQVLDQVSTLEKFGPMATVLKGALAAYQGIPILVSQYAREDLNATGVYDGVTVNRAGLILVNTTRWYVGTRRPIKVKMQPDLPSQDRFLMASYQRKDFQGHVQSATELSVNYGYNIAV
jgi:HK97 family phage major capsid protein